MRPILKSAALAALAALCWSGSSFAADEKGESHDNLTPAPDMQAVLDALQKMPMVPVTQLSATDARKQPSAADAAAYVAKEKGIDLTTANAMEYEKDIKIDGPSGNIPVRVYNPGSPTGEALPVIVYYHGGGFVLGDLNTYEQSCRALAKGSKAVLFSIGYRTAPEAKYPAAYDDAVAGYKWATMHASDYRGDNTKVAVAGESAGGNLAAGVSQAARDMKLQPPVAQLLIYPWVDNDMQDKSYKMNAMAKPLNMAMMKWFTENYVSDAQSLTDPKVFPAMAKDLGMLPPAMVITASIDPLHSEGEKYAKSMAMAGTSVHYMNYPGTTHEFFGMGAVVKEAKQAEDDATTWLTHAFMGDAMPNLNKNGEMGGKMEQGAMKDKMGGM